MCQETITSKKHCVASKIMNWTDFECALGYKFYSIIKILQWYSYLLVNRISQDCLFCTVSFSSTAIFLKRNLDLSFWQTCVRRLAERRHSFAFSIWKWIFTRSWAVVAYNNCKRETPCICNDLHIKNSPFLYLPRCWNSWFNWFFFLEGGGVVECLVCKQNYNTLYHVHHAHTNIPKHRQLEIHSTHTHT